jgi:hypothetical protein
MMDQKELLVLTGMLLVRETLEMEATRDQMAHLVHQ